jgi:hypothetical protein
LVEGELKQHRVQARGHHPLTRGLAVSCEQLTFRVAHIEDGRDGGVVRDACKPAPTERSGAAHIRWELVVVARVRAK